MQVQLLLTGNELMTGDIVDSNSAMIAQELIELGLKITRKVTVADDLTLLCAEINHMANQADILIINGGLGPTVDDLTSQALAQAMNVGLEEHLEALSHLQSWCKKRNVQLNAPNLKQTILPKGCQILANETGSAVGFYVTHQHCKIFCTPGVPHELKTMLQKQITPLVKQYLPAKLVNKVTRLQVFGLGESSLQKMIDERLPNWPKEIDLGFRAGSPLLEVKLTISCKQGLILETQWKNKLLSVLGSHFLGEVKGKPLSLPEYVINELAINNLAITTAESCTGGLIASMITGVNGASKNFEAGFVTYSNDIKTALLQVPIQTLITRGAVSEDVVLSMAQGALMKASADLVIAVSGIAGPEGGTEDKPIGTVWIAWGSTDNLKSQCLLLPFPRKYFQQYVAYIGLDLIRRYIFNLNETPSYIKERGFSPKAHINKSSQQN